MIEDRLAAVLRFIDDNDGVSVARAAKQLGLSQSELLRLLAVLGEDRSLGGLGLVALQDENSRRLLRLTADGYEWLARNP
jgi:DNA-binding IclR family transcriptional regulator